MDEIDGEDLRSIMSEYEGELYLRRLYLSLENQRMVDRSEEQGVIFSDYIRSRQQCLYGCFCFMVLFISMYYSDDLMNVKNVDWLQGTVIKGACGFLIKHLQIGPGYIYCLFNERLIGVSSAGRPRGFNDLFFSSQCWLGQLTGLRETRNLMANVNVVRLFREYDATDVLEECIVF